MTKIKIPSEKSFGITFSIIFFIINFYFYFSENLINYTLLTISILLIPISYFFPKILKLPNFLWFNLGIFLSKIMTPIILISIFYLVVTPIGILYRLFNRKKITTTWQMSQENEKVDFTKQF